MYVSLYMDSCSKAEQGICRFRTVWGPAGARNSDCPGLLLRWFSGGVTGAQFCFVTFICSMLSSSDAPSSQRDVAAPLAMEVDGRVAWMIRLLLFALFARKLLKLPVASSMASRTFLAYVGVILSGRKLTSGASGLSCVLPLSRGLVGRHT